MPNLELPDVEAIESDNPLYVLFLEESAAKLHQMWSKNMWKGRGLVAKLKSEGKSRQEVMWNEKLISLVAEKRVIEDTVKQFNDALLGLISIKPVYQPDFPAHFAHVFFEGDDGLLYETELNFPEDYRTRPQPTIMWTVQELRGHDGRKHTEEIFYGKSVYLVATPSKRTRSDMVIDYAACELQNEFDKKNPHIAKKMRADKARKQHQGLEEKAASHVFAHSSTSTDPIQYQVYFLDSGQPNIESDNGQEQKKAKPMMAIPPPHPEAN